MKQKTEFATPHSGRRSENDAYLTLAALCAQAEHCQYEMLEKMRRWELDDEAQARVMQRLVSERYVDDERYARAFVKDKVRYNKWGRRKVEQALWQKTLSASASMLRRNQTLIKFSILHSQFSIQNELVDPLSRLYLPTPVRGVRSPTGALRTFTLWRMHVSPATHQLPPEAP